MNPQSDHNVQNCMWNSKVPMTIELCVQVEEGQYHGFDPSLSRLSMKSL